MSTLQDWMTAASTARHAAPLTAFSANYAAAPWGGRAAAVAAVHGAVSALAARQAGGRADNP